MQIILINLPSPALAEPYSNFPLGLGYVAAAIKHRGYPVEVWDLCDLSIRQMQFWTIPETRAKIFGMSVTTPQLPSARKIATLIKAEHPKSIVVAGGPHTLVGKQDFLEDPNFDSVVVEEGEFSFYELIRHYELYGEVERIYWNPSIRLLDDVPFPARHLFPQFKEHAQMTHQLLKGDYIEGGQTTIIGSRGCPNACAFCAPHPRKVRFRSPENVVAEIDHIIENFGIRQFKTQDDTFTINKKWVLKLCEQLSGRTVYLRTHTRVDAFDEELAAAMYNAGFKILCFGIESFSQRLLDTNHKHTTIDQVERALKIAHNYGFKTVGFLIYGMPGENEASVAETQEGILRNKPYLDYLNLATMVPLPGTPIASNPEQFGCEIVEQDFTQFWIVNHDKSDMVLVKTNGVPLETMRRLKVEMYQFMRDQGYARPEWK